MKIKIIDDYGEVYESGRVMDAQELIDDYISELFFDCDGDGKNLETVDFLRTVDEDTAMKFIKDMWGIEYEILN